MYHYFLKEVYKMTNDDLQTNMRILLEMTLEKIGDDDWIDGTIELDSVSSEDNEQIIALEEKVDTVHQNQKLILDCMRKIASLL